MPKIAGKGFRNYIDKICDGAPEKVLIFWKNFIDCFAKFNESHNVNFNLLTPDNERIGICYIRILPYDHTSGMAFICNIRDNYGTIDNHLYTIIRDKIMEHNAGNMVKFQYKPSEDGFFLNNDNLPAFFEIVTKELSQNPSTQKSKRPRLSGRPTDTDSSINQSENGNIANKQIADSSTAIDKFHREILAGVISDRILIKKQTNSESDDENENEKKSFSHTSMGLFSEWGNGKSSIIEMIDEKIKKNNRTMMVKIDATSCDSKEAIWGLILRKLSETYIDNKLITAKIYNYLNLRIKIIGLCKLILLFLLTSIISFFFVKTPIYKSIIGSTLNDTLKLIPYINENDLTIQIFSSLLISTPLFLMYFCIFSNNYSKTTFQLSGFFEYLKLKSRKDEVSEYINIVIKLILADSDFDQILIIIDEIDRCETEKMNEIFDAIHILQSMKGVYLIIAANLDVLASTLINKRGYLFKREKCVREALNYIEKYVGLPIYLPSINYSESNTEAEEYLDSLYDIYRPQNEIVVNKQSEPSVNKQSEPSVNKQSEPSVNKQSEPSVNKQSEPSVNKQSESDDLYYLTDEIHNTFKNTLKEIGGSFNARFIKRLYNAYYLFLAINFKAGNPVSADNRKLFIEAYIESSEIPEINIKDKVETNKDKSRLNSIKRLKYASFFINTDDPCMKCSTKECQKDKKNLDENS